MKPFPTLKYLSTITLCNTTDYKTDVIWDILNTACQTRHTTFVDRFLWDLDVKFRQELEAVKNISELPKDLQKEVVTWMEIVSENMLQWCFYHANKFDLLNYNCVFFLTESLVTLDGEILYVKAAERNRSR